MLEERWRLGWGRVRAAQGFGPCPTTLLFGWVCTCARCAACQLACQNLETLLRWQRSLRCALRARWWPAVLNQSFCLLPEGVSPWTADADSRLCTLCLSGTCCKVSSASIEACCHRAAAVSLLSGVQECKVERHLWHLPRTALLYVCVVLRRCVVGMDGSVAAGCSQRAQLEALSLLSGRQSEMYAAQPAERGPEGGADVLSAWRVFTNCSELCCLRAAQSVPACVQCGVSPCDCCLDACVPLYRRTQLPVLGSASAGCVSWCKSVHAGMTFCMARSWCPG